jgi:hypothetical protein
VGCLSTSLSCLRSNWLSLFAFPRSCRQSLARVSNSADSPTSRSHSRASASNTGSHAAGGGSSFRGIGCVALFANVTFIAPASLELSSLPCRIRSSISIRSFVLVLTRSPRGSEYACTFSANCCSREMTGNEGGAIPPNPSQSLPEPRPPAPALRRRSQGQRGSERTLARPHGYVPFDSLGNSLARNRSNATCLRRRCKSVLSSCARFCSLVSRAVRNAPAVLYCFISSISGIAQPAL